MKYSVAFIYMNNQQNVGRGAGYVAAAITRSGHYLTFFDTQYVPFKKIVSKIVKGRYDIVMVSTMTMHFPETVRLIYEIKKRTSLPVLVGGIHPTIVGAPLLSEVQQIDYLCIGEGESMVSEFLDAWGSERLYDVPNLAYRKNGVVYSNPLRPVEDLSLLPPFPWELFPGNSIVQSINGFLYVDASRGCPYSCTYCSNTIYLQHYGKKYLRFRPVDSVVNELIALRDRYRPRLFYFGDEMILSMPAYAIELFKAIKDQVGVPYGCMARAEYINEETVRIMKQTGCRYIAIGVECGDEEFRKSFLNRHMSNKTIEQAFSLVKSAGIFTTSFNMVGYPVPDDNRLTESSLQLNRRLSPDYAQFTIFFPFPGTRLYDYCIQHDLIDPEKVGHTSTYYADSVLREVSVVEVCERLHKELNPRGLVIDIDDGIGLEHQLIKFKRAFEMIVIKFKNIINW